MNRRIKAENSGRAVVAAAAMTLCMLAFLPGCGDLDLGDLGDLIGDLGGIGGGSNDCTFANDGVCDDGRPDSAFSVCAFGTDSADCDGVGGGGGGGGGSDCLDNLDRFSGTYFLSVISRELGIQDYSSEGEEICGPGEEFFGDLPTIATMIVSGNSAIISVDINTERYSASGIFQAPTTPREPLVGGTFFERSGSATPGVNSCGVESPYISDSREFPEDGGRTTLTVWVYAQEDAVNIVVESFWIADNSPILSRCHGVVILQGTK